MRPLLAAACAALLCACGPSMTQLRSHLLHSPRRCLAVVPFDSRGGQRNAAPMAANLMLGKLAADGFRLNQGAVMKAYKKSPLSRGPAFDRIQDAALLARQLKMGAALLGSVDQAFEQMRKTPQVVQWQPVPPPACCYDQYHPCAHSPIYDPSVNHYVDRCQGTHRRVVVQAASTARTAAATVRLRLVDAATATVLWEGTDTEAVDETTLYGALDDATTSLNQSMAALILKDNL